MMAAWRKVYSLSLSPRNPDAVAVSRALIEREIEPRQRSATILEWAAAYLAGRAMECQISTAPTMSDEELDTLLDDF
jgi:hypothetical protein